MRKIMLYIFLFFAFSSLGCCSDDEKLIDAIWYEVYFEPQEKVWIYYPDDAHVLTFYQDSTIKVNAGKHLVQANTAVTRLEIIAIDSMLVTYQWGATLNSYYNFGDGDTLFIEQFSRSDITIPFPFNIESSYFLKTGYETYTE